MAESQYLKLISVDAKEKEKENLATEAEDAAIQVQADISAAKKARRDAERELNGAKAARPFNSEDYITAKRNLDAATEDYDDLVAMQAELFGAAE